MLNLQSGMQTVFERVRAPQSAKALEGPPLAAPPPRIVAQSSAMRRLLRDIYEAAKNPLCLIIGKSGTGKGQMAREIFIQKRRRGHVFSKIQPRSLSAEEEDKALFNGDVHPGRGLLQRHLDSVVFIKGMERLKFSSQIKLFKALKYLREKGRDGEVHLIASARMSLSDKASSGAFYDKLYDLAMQSALFMPELRDRKEDLPDLFHMFCREEGFFGEVEPQALQMIQSAKWERQADEMKSLARKLCAKHRDRDIIQASDLPLSLKESAAPYNVKYNPEVSLESLKNQYIKLAIKHFQCKKRAARALGISVKTIYNKESLGALI